MWGPGPWMVPMWGFWWIFPVLGILLCIFFVAILVRTFVSGGHFMCIGAASARKRRDQSASPGGRRAARSTEKAGSAMSAETKHASSLVMLFIAALAAASGLAIAGSRFKLPKPPKGG